MGIPPDVFSKKKKLNCTRFVLVIRYSSLMEVNGKLHGLVNYSVENS